MAHPNYIILLGMDS